MSYRIEKDTNDIIIDGWEQGIQPSPHKGIANMQGANISTELNEVVVSFSRFQQSQSSIINGTLTATVPLGATKLAVSSPLQAGQWIEVTASTISSLSAGNYYVSANDVSGNVTLSTHYDPTASVSVVTHGTSGTATFSITIAMGRPAAKAFERYSDGTNNQYRYYVLDSAGLVWVYDTANEATTGLTWFLPDLNVNYYTGTVPSGVGVINGWLFVFAAEFIYTKSTVNLGQTTSSNNTTYRKMRTTLSGTAQNARMDDINTSFNPHFSYTSHQGRLYYTDGAYLGSITPDTSIQIGVNIQSYAQYTAASTTGTVTVVLSGGFPTDFGGTRVPAVFFAPQAGSIPSALSVDTVYWIEDIPNATLDGFKVYAASSGGSALDISSGAVGPQYFNTFYPVGDDASNGGSTATMTFSPQRVALPTFEVAQCMAEIGNTIIIGCKGNVAYPWNQVDITPSGIISLPESNIVSVLTVNQMAYLFAGNQGNIYITDGSTASLVINVPDYVAGVPGSPGTYIEATYTWGGAMYLRGRVYFSILDQQTFKTGNCGGIWSFVPTQNLYIGQDTGIALHLESQNSYGTYNGVATILINREDQSSIAPLYWSGWYSSISGPLYGIDYTNPGTNASFPAVIETDAIPIGTFLNQKTLSQIEYKLGSTLDTGATVTGEYRQDITSAWTPLGTFITDASKLGAYVAVNFEKGQWLQLRFILTPVTSTTNGNSYIRFREIRLR